MSGRYFSNIVSIHFFNAPSLEKPENQKHHNMDSAARNFFSEGASWDFGARQFEV